MVNERGRECRCPSIPVAQSMGKRRVGSGAERLYCTLKSSRCSSLVVAIFLVYVIPGTHGKKSHSRFLTRHCVRQNIFGDFALWGKYTREKWICLRRQINGEKLLNERQRRLSSSGVESITHGIDVMQIDRDRGRGSMRCCLALFRQSKNRGLVAIFHSIPNFLCSGG